MKIHGLQKLTLLDFPGKVACTVFTYGCNFRCPFCHNASLVVDSAPDEIHLNDFFDFLKKRSGILDGVCLSGGEPLLQNGVEDFFKQVKDLGLATKLDTNGSFPEKLKILVDGGLVDYIAMDLKNSKEKYALTCGTTIDLSQIEESVKFIESCGVDHEFRTTCVKHLHTPDSMIGIGEWIRNTNKYFLQSFIDSGNLVGTAEGIDAKGMQELLAVVRPFIPNAEIRGI